MKSCDFDSDKFAGYARLNDLDDLEKYYYDLVEILKDLNKVQIKNVLNVLRFARENNKMIFILGNGGSASSAEHYVNDFMKIGGLKAISLTNISVVTALGNDISYDDIFVEQLKSLMSSGDVVIGITGSGNSMNVVKALEYARDNSGIPVGILGFDGGKCLDVLNGFPYILVNSKDYGYVEDVHMSLSHSLSRMIKEKEIVRDEFVISEEKVDLRDEEIGDELRQELFNDSRDEEKIYSRGFGSW